MATTLDVKKRVAAQLGKTDYATPNTVRDTAIVEAREEFYGAHDWLFLVKTVSTKTLASDFKKVKEVYSYSGLLKRSYKLVNLEDVSSYDTSCYVYAVDFENGVIVTNQSETPEVTYHSIPSDTLDDNFEEPTNITPLVLLSVANYWLAAERDEANYDRFHKRYLQKLAAAVSIDNLMRPHGKALDTKKV